ncbi:MAG: helix-turn-helix domain-containing protein [Oscillospiraceae bacterium]|nr:helix-turn-helix domain-containing protein [Oscillospiraceae bacterium]
MDQYITASAIRTLREARGLTQKQLADALAVSDKTVSKWECGRGLPDITLLEPLAAALGVSLTELVSGRLIPNRNRAGSVLRAKFYVCPVCGNVIWALGQGAFGCCGITLPPLEAEPGDAAHAITVTEVENEWYITMAHPMTKQHFISFFACVTPDTVIIKKLYPEQDAAVRIPRLGRGRLYACCSREGLFEYRL